MGEFDRKKHWQNIYQTKELNEVSWYQPVPETSLAFIEKYCPLKVAKIIDIGGGDSFLAEHLLASGYTDITVLDISEAALEKAKKRLGVNADKIKWIVADAAHFVPSDSYDLWHDRAAFHFLTDIKDVAAYSITAHTALNDNGIIIIGTFSEEGPKKCSGIEIKQYSKEALTEQFNNSFDKLECITTDHKTPFDTIQNFTFCSFRKV